jgi:hypothetical protein
MINFLLEFPTDLTIAYNLAVLARVVSLHLQLVHAQYLSSWALRLQLLLVRYQLLCGIQQVPDEEMLLCFKLSNCANLREETQQIFSLQ